MSLKPTGWPREAPPEVIEPTFAHPLDEDYAPLNADLLYGEWPDLSDPDEAPLWGMGEPLTTDPYEWKRERNG